jgi:hypothetical protein
MLGPVAPRRGADPEVWTDGNTDYAVTVPTAGQLLRVSGATIVGATTGPGVMVGGYTHTLEMWVTGRATSVSAGTSSSAINTLKAYPVIFPVAHTLDRITFEVTTGGGAGSVFRVGIYAATSITNPYPSALVVDGGEHVTTVAAGTGLKTSTISTAVSAGLVYWLASLGGVATVTCRSMNTASWFFGVYSDGANLSVPNYLSVAQAYGALPDPFTGSALPTVTTTPPVIAWRYSA